MPNSRKLQVKELMTSDFTSVYPEMPILRAIQILLDKDISAAPVVDGDGKLVGILSEKDCLQILSSGGFQNLPSRTVAHYMKKKVLTMTPDMDITTAGNLFIAHHYKRYPIVEQGVLVGMLTRREVLIAMNEIIR